LTTIRKTSLGFAPSAMRMPAFTPLGSSAENTAVTVNGNAGLANGWMVSGEYFSGLGVTPR
jgi:hypothetical protein